MSTEWQAAIARGLKLDTGQTASSHLFLRERLALRGAIVRGSSRGIARSLSAAIRKIVLQLRQ
ncbi:MAG TPA: hypothetical protein VF856_09370, partial [Gemmatimonadaceae bacterium]